MNAALSIQRLRENFERISIVSPLEHFRFCQKINSDSQFRLALRYPYAKSYQPSQAALALFAHLRNIEHPPLVPRLGKTGAPDCLLPMGVARELALFWAELGRKKGDEELLLSAQKLEAWLDKMKCVSPTLFYMESDFEEREWKPVEGFSVDSYLGITSRANASFTLSGWNTGLGAMQLGSVQIPTFGPQNTFLNNTSGFGLSLWDPRDGWTRCFGSREIWLHLQPSFDDNRIRFSVRFIGITPNEPMMMAFYVKALRCAVEDKTIFYPASLQRYRGRGRRVVFDESVQLECSEELPLQVIPLAGSNCFWNASFLVAFEFNSSMNQASYSIQFV